MVHSDPYLVNMIMTGCLIPAAFSGLFFFLVTVTTRMVPALRWQQ